MIISFKRGFLVIVLIAAAGQLTLGGEIIRENSESRFLQGAREAPARVADLEISEILVANVRSTGLADEDGEQQDWIEIHNRGDTPVDLVNWSLSDDPDLPGLWRFPARILEPNEYIVIFASGKDRAAADSQSKLHTNFKLAGAGEHLGLYTPDSPRVLASGFTQYPEQGNDISYGIDSAGSLRYFAVPTPARPNGFSTIVGACAPVRANVNRGHFATPFDLTVSSETPGAVIRYTTDGSEPDANSPPFPSSLRISRTTLFRAAAFKENFLPSKTTTQSYLFNIPENVRSLPVISIVTATNNLYGRTGILGINGGNYNSGPWTPNRGQQDQYHNPSQHGLAWERPVSVEWIRPDDNSGFQIDCGIRVHGSDYNRPRITRSSKVSFTLYFRGDYGPGRLEYPLFPLTSVRRFDQIVLRAGFNEQGNPFIRDEIHRRLSSDMGQIASHGTLAVLFVNGVYNASSPWYNPCERIHEEFMQEHLGGGDKWDVVSPSFAESAGADGVVDGNRASFQSVANYVSRQLVTNPSVYANVSRLLDLTNFVDYCLLNAYSAMGDWPPNNWRAGKDRSSDGPWRFIVWDAEWGMGIYSRTVNINSFTETGGGPNDSGLGSVNNSEIARMYTRLRTSPEFRLLWADRVQKHFFNGGALTGGNITNRFNRLRDELRPLIRTMDTAILRWARDREPIFFRQMRPYDLLAPIEAPAFSQFGGRVPAGFRLSIASPRGTVYYTLDGSDPRILFTGDASPSARAYLSPVPLGATVHVKARALEGTTWSALTEATFTVGALGVPLRISEILHRPSGGSPYEFIELQNTSEARIDIGGFYFKGIDFIFKDGAAIEAGGRIVLNSGTSPVDWKARFPGVSTAGAFGGSLKNSGERITLFDKNRAVVTAVEYRDAGGWPAVPDVGGPSLEIIDLAGDPNDPANWKLSAAPYGTPGLANSSRSTYPVFLNEIMAENLAAVELNGAFPDWIEIHNSSAAAVGLTGWSLSDDGNPRKFVFPQGVTIAPSGYLTVWCDGGESGKPGLRAGFRLSKNGESVFLYDAATNRVDAVTFGFQIADHSVGRIDSVWRLTEPTPSAPNVPVAVAPAESLVINEWLSNPLPGGEDWIELFNTSATQPAALQGIYLGTTAATNQLRALSFVAPSGLVQLIADGQFGPGHLNLRLPAAGGRIALYDATGAEIQNVVSGAHAEGVSEGRLPDGSARGVTFPKSSSPGAANYLPSYNGPALNEVLARNRSVDVRGGFSDFIELHNASVTPFNLAGMSLSADQRSPGRWVFSPNTILGPGAFLLVACDASTPPSTSPETLNLGEGLDGNSGGVYLFNTAGQQVDSIEYGFQIDNVSIGLSDGEWRLLIAPSPGAANLAPAPLAESAGLRLNEWLANPVDGSDWFEVHNPADQPVDLSTFSLTDDPSIAGQDKFRPAPFSLIGAGSFIQWMADGNQSAGRNHASFSLAAAGDSILVYSVDGARVRLVDSVGFGAQQAGVSEGRFPDGSGVTVSFPNSPTPGAPNALDQLDTDGDGIPDAKEIEFGLNPNDVADGALDFDGDGATNAEEYAAGTDHRNSRSYFGIAEIRVGVETVISFKALANRSYSVFYTDSLADPKWIILEDIPARESNRSVSVSDRDRRENGRYYRLATPARNP